MLSATPGYAGDVNGLTTFSAGTPARAAEVNGNFTAVKTAVDDNHARISTLEGVNAAARITVLETSPSITGNLTLVPSTATAGNIMKGTAPFLHDFGTDNTFLGENAGNFAMSGTENTATGAAALASNISGRFNTATGAGALQNNSIGDANTAVGQNALNANTSGVFNTVVGAGALLFNTTGNANTVSGSRALQRNTTGSSNIAIGHQAGINLTTGSSNIIIGNLGATGESNTIRIGAADQTRAFIAGIRGVTPDNTGTINVVIDTAGQLGTINSSRRVKDDIADMADGSAVLMKLRPVTFHYKSDRDPAGRMLQYGLVAEEVAAVAPGLVAHGRDGAIETVLYQFLPPMLLNEFQKQQRTIGAQAAMLTKQTARIAELERDRQQQTARIEALEKQAAHVAASLGRLERAKQAIAARP